MTRPLDHDRVSELMPAFLDGRLDADDRVAVEHHLEGCADCRQERRGLELLRDQDEVQLSTAERTELEHRVMSGISEETGEHAVVPLPTRRPVAARVAQVLGAAAAVAALGTFFYLGVTGGGDDEAAQSGRTADTAVEEESGNLQGAGGGGSDGRRKANKKGRNAVAASSADAGAEFEQQPVPRPAFTVADEPYTAVRLQKLGESSLASVTFANYYSANDAGDGRNTLLEQLVGSAENSAGSTVAAQVEECGAQVLETEDPTIPTFGAIGDLDDHAVLVLGFAWSRDSNGPLDRYMVWAWERGSCDAAVEFVEGRIETSE